MKRIPIIRGNRKYPAHYGVASEFPKNCENNNLIYDQQPKAKDFSLQCNEKSMRQDVEVIVSTKSNFKIKNKIKLFQQIIRKNNDPKRDVFVLHLGKDISSGQHNGIQLEMKTPKNPLASTSSNKHTISQQTYDGEFVSQIKKRSKKGGKKGGKKK